MPKYITRRQFSRGALAAGVVATRTAFSAFPAHEQVRLGIIGVGNRGDQLIGAFKPQPNTQFVAVCDVYRQHLEMAAKKIGGDPFLTGDYRRLLDRKDIDAVVIATPDHWHALQFIDACEAGKDAYVEKPLSLTISEGRTMVEVARRTKRVNAMGVQRRSSVLCRKAAEMVQRGEIGQVTYARCFHIRNEAPLGIGRAGESSPPPGLDWDMWLGPAPKVPYHENRCFYKFRWFRNYSGGQLTNMGTHYIDLIQWAIGKDAPTSVMAVGGKYAVDDDRDMPDTMEVIWEYEGGPIVTFTQINANGAEGTKMGNVVELRGTKGTIYCGGPGLDVVQDNVMMEDIVTTGPIQRASGKKQTTKKVGPSLHEKGQIEDEKLHAANFVECVRSRQPTNCPVEVGHRSTTTTLLGLIAQDRKRLLTWDSKNEKITNDSEANKLLSYDYREPWKLPLV
jgi:predicted dehydrogenase